MPAASPAALVKIGSNPDPDTIVLHPRYYRPWQFTATQEALRAHEYYHVWQRANIDDFESVFHENAVATEKAGLDPWENPLEEPAYDFEQMVKQELLSQGYPETWPGAFALIRPDATTITVDFGSLLVLVGVGIGIIWYLQRRR